MSYMPYIYVYIQSIVNGGSKATYNSGGITLHPPIFFNTPKVSPVESIDSLEPAIESMCLPGTEATEAGSVLFHRKRPLWKQKIN
jgi:hypothetical protein